MNVLLKMTYLKKTKKEFCSSKFEQVCNNVRVRLLREDILFLLQTRSQLLMGNSLQ